MRAVLITSSVLILVLIALRYLLRGRISPRVQYALWLLVAVRLLVPISLPGTGLSVLNILTPETGDTAVYVSSHGVTTSAPAPETGTLGDGRAMDIYYDDFGIRHFYPVGEAPPAGTEYTTVPAEQIFNLGNLLRTVWLCGAMAMAAWFLAVNLSVSARARKGARRMETTESPVPVYVSETVPSPCLLGLVRQRIYVTPACTVDPAGLRHVLAHELTHRRQGDPWWSLVRAACLCFYWFDPLVWWAAALSRRDCELSCDAGAIRRLGEPERIAYGQTLVGLVAAGVSPGSLLQTATTMRSGKSGLKERVALIAKKPRMLAVTALCLVTVVAIAAAATFTGARPDRTDAASLTAEERTAQIRAVLSQVPGEYADNVVMEKPTEDGGTFRFAYYYAPDYDSDYGGWLFWVNRWDQADFEAHLCAGDTSGVFCFARDTDGYYYAVHCPTDVNFSPENGEDYHAVQEGLQDWAETAVLAVPGVEPFTEEDVQALRSQPFQFQGDHITAVYYPYYTVNGDREITWTFILSQPMARGAEGIWCVEQVWYPGEFPQRQVVRPDTDLPMADYYADLQSQADDGQADWALDPTEVCLRFAHSFEGGHLNAAAESFELSEPYSSAPYSGNEEAAEDLSVLLDNDTGRLEATLDYNSGGTWQADALSVSTSALSVQTLLDTLTGDGYSWVDTRWTWPIATDPWASEEDGDYFLSLSVPDTRCSLCVYRDSPYVQYIRGNGTSVIYQVTPVDDAQSATAAVRAWYDEQRDAPLTADVQAGTLMDAIRSNDTLVMELTRTDGVGGGRYVTTRSGTDNADYTAHNFTSPSLFTWSRAEGGMPPSPEPEASLTLSSPDGRYAIRVWTGSNLVCCTDSGETYWLQAESTGQNVFSGSIFQHLRFWYDEVELAALRGDVVIPDTGQGHLAIAQAWADAMQAVNLQVTPGSKYALSYVRNVVSLEENAMDSWYQPFMLETEHFYFSYVRIFVPENKQSLGWSMAGNTGGYDGTYGEAPEGAFMNWQMGPMYRTDDGWRCDGTGTGP
ncbi:M56 family metallopeptidase [uncultured Oscillibacter sp.]|uniref:M56 family metallopeptidase n=1 Tax=uncultured Oscillibacter sp. TaxID=876091 RepID=UPI0025D883B3|nr:M56 family metallopeptidase [uncultured Oscillibacter sp.]